MPWGWFRHGFGIRTDGVTALMMASQERHLDAIKYLAGEGGDATDDRAINGCTALMLAALEGHPYVATTHGDRSRNRSLRSSLVGEELRGHFRSLSKDLTAVLRSAT